MRLLLVLLAFAAISAAQNPPETREFVQAVEFPYYAYPRTLWERELVWLKTVGIQTVQFSIPWNWHRMDDGSCDFTGRTSPRRDLVSFVRLLRRLELRAWIRPLPPVKGWLNSGHPAGVQPDRKSAQPWLNELEKLLATQTEKHGGPIAFIEGAPAFLDAPQPPLPVTVVSARDAGALMRSRRAMAAAHGSLLWEDVEDALIPAGWQQQGGSLYRAGAVSLDGDERPTVAGLRRDAALLRYWATLLPGMRSEPHAVKSAAGKLPPGVNAVELVSRTPEVASAVSLSNHGRTLFHDTLRIWDPFNKHAVEIDNVALGPHESLWLPVNVSLGNGGLCRECSAFSNAEHIVYATAELQSIGFENGVLAMEFAAPAPAEVVLQLARRPSGPYLAGGHPTDFDFDEKTLRARLKIPQGKGPASLVRVGLAIEPPEISAFFVEAKRLIIGQENVISTSYSSEKLADRSRLRMPAGFTATATRKSPLEIDYAVQVPSDALHGDWANLAIEADGVALGRARVQLFRPVSVRLTDAMRLHFGHSAALVVDPPIIPIDGTSGRDLDVKLLNNSPQMQSFGIAASGDGFQFLPAKTELNSGAAMERVAQFRVFPDETTAGGLHDWMLRLSSGTKLEIGARFLSIPRGQTVVWSADLDGDGLPEWVLENQRARAVFSTQDGGRWLEFVWKDSNLNVLPENGALPGTGPVEVRALDGALELSAKNWKRTVRLAGPGASLTVEQSTALPAETLESGKQNEVTLQIKRESANRAVYNLSK